ncbi:MAG: AAA family ATPase [Clostridia bacterium]|nr:AAA family ATPase [Clostridia bacterium]
MVILITGASHTGKTVLAQKLLEKLHYPYLSVDHLKMGLIRSEQTALTPEDDEQLTEYLWPIVREMIKTAIENRQDLIVEGCYVPFGWRKDFDAWYLASIRFVCLAMTDAYIDARFDAIRSHACEIESRLDDTYCTADRMKAENRAVIAGNKTAGEAVTLIDADWEAAIAALIKEIV